MTPASEQTKSSGNWRALLLLLLVFVAGLGFGAGGVVLVGRHMLRRAFTATADETGPIDRMLAATERNVTRNLGLTPAERAAVHEELVATSREFKRDRATFIDAVRGITGDTIARIAKRLPPEKGVRLEKLARERLQPLGMLPKTSPTPAPR